jgi:hypothetical protein
MPSTPFSATAPVEIVETRLGLERADQPLGERNDAKDREDGRGVGG